MIDRLERLSFLCFECGAFAPNRVSSYHTSVQIVLNIVESVVLGNMMCAVVELKLNSCAGDRKYGRNGDAFD